MTESNWGLIVLLVSWALVLTGLACLVYIAYCGRRNDRALAAARARNDRLDRKERLARLRHRDFPAFCLEVNNLRAQRSEKPIPVELLRKVQFNLMYTIDED